MCPNLPYFTHTTQETGVLGAIKENSVHQNHQTKFSKNSIKLIGEILEKVRAYNR